MAKLPGEQLRDNIAQLLRMKYQTVEVEKRLAATTADVMFVDDTNRIFPRKIAIEAKDWTRRLTSESLATITNLYAPSLRSREIDYLWIVGREPLSGSPKQSLDSMNDVKYSTFDEFRSALMNFSGLMSNNILLFEHDDASKNFVETRVKDSKQSLFDYVVNWLKSDRSGLIVYGGYGLGKTTFSIYLAHHLSQKCFANEFDRIPIRLALGGLYSKQDLIALICSALSGGESGVSVKDFSYGLFLEMNRQGQYLLILDGFDEMRHAMDLDDFVYTFEQMKPLFAGRAKVIILGRPDSFLSTQEEDKVLSALFDGGHQKDRWLDTVEVSFFSKPEVVGYLDNYINGRSEKLSTEQLGNYGNLLSKLPESEESILSRPVQLKMFTKIIDECLSSSALLTRYQLYRAFIYNFISREAQKPASQQMIGANRKDLKDDRAKFMREVAWWLLNTKKENRFLADEIPVEIVPPTIRAGRNTSSAIREAIVGSVIEPVSQAGVLGNKGKKYYFFPHKSYLEFLVADYFQSQRFSVEMYRSFLANVNNEILDFLAEGPVSGVENLRQGLDHYLGLLDRRILEVCATDKKIGREIVEEEKGNKPPSRIYAHYFYLTATKKDPEVYLLVRLADSVTLNSALANFVCIANELGSLGSSNLARALLLNCITNVSSHNVRLYLERGEITEVYRADTEGLRASILSECVSKSPNGKAFIIDVDRLYSFLANASRSSFSVDVRMGPFKNNRIAVPVDSVQKGVGRELAPYILRLAQYEPLGPMFPVKLLGQAADRFKF